MSRMLQLGDTQVDDTKLADLCRGTALGSSLFSGRRPAERCGPTATSTCWWSSCRMPASTWLTTPGLMLDLSQLLGRKVDLVSKNGLKPLIRASVLEEAAPALVCGMRAYISRICRGYGPTSRSSSREPISSISQSEILRQRRRSEAGRHRRGGRTSLRGAEDPPTRGALAPDRRLSAIFLSRLLRESTGTSSGAPPRIAVLSCVSRWL